jgi:hypothetical protein
MSFFKYLEKNWRNVKAKPMEGCGCFEWTVSRKNNEAFVFEYIRKAGARSSRDFGWKYWAVLLWGNQV